MNRISTTKIFICGLFFITLVTLVCYIMREKDHQVELLKISEYENKLRREKRDLELIRQKTTPCTVPDLNNPRSCYFDSGYQCSWNFEAKQCDSK